MPVELNVKTQLGKIITELQAIQAESDKVADGLSDAGAKIGDHLNTQTQKTHRYLAGLQSFGGRVASQLISDFKALASVNALAGSLKFSSQFAGSVKETISLSDSIRRLGSTLGITGQAMARFQDKMTRGLGQIGLSSEAAANALGGLAQTPVRGENNLLAYSRSAGQLASISNERGQEGTIAAGLSRVVTARGGDPNDLAQMKAVSDDVLRIRRATGRSASEVLGAMDQLFSNANKAFQKRLQGGGAVSLASAALIGGKGSTAFLERYLSSNRFQQFGPQAQGLGSIVGKDGSLNLKAMEGVLKEAKGRGLGDAQAGLTTFGMSDEEAQGFIRLTEAMRSNGALIEENRKRVVDQNEEYRKSMGLGDAFKANLNKLKGLLPTGGATQGLTDILGSASQSTGGAAAVTGGAGLLAALLAGGGLRGIGKGLGVGGFAKGAAIEAATGRQVQPVYVTNAAEIGAGGAISTALGGAGLAGKVGKTLGVVGAGVAAFEAGGAVGNYLDSTETGGKVFDKLADVLLALTQKLGYMNGKPIKVELNPRQLKESRQPTRGASYGP